MNYRILEKAIQIGLFLGILKIILEIFNLLLVPSFFINQWYFKFFLALIFLGLFIIFSKALHLRLLSSSQKILTIFIILQVSSIMVCGFEIFIHHSYDITYKNRIAEFEIQQLKIIDKEFENENNAKITNREEFYQTETNKIIENYSVEYLLIGFYFSIIGNFFLMVLMKLFLDFYLIKFNSIHYK